MSNDFETQTFADQEYHEDFFIWSLMPKTICPIINYDTDKSTLNVSRGRWNVMYAAKKYTDSLHSIIRHRIRTKLQSTYIEFTTSNTK